MTAEDPLRRAERDDCPQPPWLMTGRFWMGLAPVADPISVPGDLTILTPRRVVVVIAKYETGTLAYSELAVGPLVWTARRAGILIQRIWVDSPASLRGGRELWGIPKQLADFTWHADTLGVAADGRPLAEFVLGPAGRRLAPILVPGWAFGELDGHRVFLRGHAVAALARASVRIMTWQEPLPRLTGQPVMTTLAGDPCRFTFPSGRILHRVRASVNRPPTPGRRQTEPS